MSRLLLDFLSVHRGLGEEEAFARFVGQEPMASWVKGDSHRRERIRREFRLAWRQRQAAGAVSPRTVEVQARRQAAPTGLHPPPPAAARPTDDRTRVLPLLCTACGQPDVCSRGGVVECRVCGRVYDDLLDLVPVRRVGPFAYVFGAGWRGAATAAGLTLVLASLYGAFRWL